jgi:tryptophan-rich sensory protein
VARLAARRGGRGSGRQRTGVRSGLRDYGVQLALNATWAPVFFGAQRLDAALLVILTLLVAIGETIRRFRRVAPAAAALLLPYVAWVAFATVLNWSIWRLNRG